MALTGNIERFLNISTPIINNKRDGKRSKPYPTISNLFYEITRCAAKGLKFDFSEEAHNGYSNSVENEELLIYTPVLSLFKLKFKKELRLPKVQFETSKDSIFSQLTPSTVIRTKLPDSTMRLLEKT